MLETSRAVGGYLRAVTSGALATGTLADIGLPLAGVPFPLALGAITGIGEYVPYVGTTLAAILVG
jgi:predicted PurR-regulated permease PerM